MKAAKTQKHRLRPRNPWALAPQLMKGGAHESRGKHAARARQQSSMRKQLRDDTNE